MTNYTKLYWLTRLDSIQAFFMVGGTFIIVASILLLCVYWLESYSIEDEVLKKWSKMVKIGFFIGSLFMCISVFIPSQKEAIFIIAGGKTIDFIEQDSSVQNIPSQATEIIAKYLDNKINELEKETK